MRTGHGGRQPDAAARSGRQPRREDSRTRGEGWRVRARDSRFLLGDGSEQSTPDNAPDHGADTGRHGRRLEQRFESECGGQAPPAKPPCMPRSNSLVKATVRGRSPGEGLHGQLVDCIRFLRRGTNCGCGNEPSRRALTITGVQVRDPDKPSQTHRRAAAARPRRGGEAEAARWHGHREPRVPAAERDPPRGSRERDHRNVQPPRRAAVPGPTRANWSGCRHRHDASWPPSRMSESVHAG
jgi:hypothetical protein